MTAMDDTLAQPSSQDCLLIGLGEIGTVHRLPVQLRAKWAAAAEHQHPDRSLSDLEARLTAADTNRQASQGFAAIQHFAYGKTDWLLCHLCCFQDCLSIADGSDC